MLNEVATTATQIGQVFEQNYKFTLMVIAGLWIINGFNWLIGKPLNALGIRPRTKSGLIGIIFSPILHANAEHLFFNSIPLFILLSLVPAYGKTVFYDVTIFIIVVSGLATWAFARNAIHLGASSLIMGYWSFLITHAYRSPDYLSMTVAGIMLYYLGGLLLNLFPQSEKVSWEGHLFGFLAGIAAGFMW